MNNDMNNLNENDIKKKQMKDPHEEFFKFYYEKFCPGHSAFCCCCCDEYFNQDEGRCYLLDRKYEDDIDFINWKLKQTTIVIEKTEETEKENEKESEKTEETKKESEKTEEIEEEIEDEIEKEIEKTKKETKKEIEKESEETEKEIEKNEEIEKESEKNEETEKESEEIEEYCELCDKINDDTHIACNHLLYGCDVNYNCYFCLEIRYEWMRTKQGSAMLRKKKAEGYTNLQLSIPSNFSLNGPCLDSNWDLEDIFEKTEKTKNVYASKIIREEICELCGDGDDDDDGDHGACSHAIYGCRDYCFSCMCGRNDWLRTDEGKDLIRRKQAEGYSASQLCIKSFSCYLDSETDTESDSHSESEDLKTEKKTEDLNEDLFKYLNEPCESDPSLRNYQYLCLNS